MFSLSSSGIIRLSEGFHNLYPLKDYLDLFDQAAYQIQDLLDSSFGGNGKTDIIIGKLSDKYFDEVEMQNH